MHLQCFIWTLGIMSVFRCSEGGLVEAEVQVAQPGGSAIIGCEISYHSEITWVRQRSAGSPEVLLQVYLVNSATHYRYESRARFRAENLERSLALRISGVEEADAGLYFCLGVENKVMKVGRGRRLEVGESASDVPSNHTSEDCACSTVRPSHYAQLYAAGLGLGVLAMSLAVVITHLKTRKIHMPV